QAQVSLSGGTANESTTAAATQVTGTISATDVDGAITGYTVVSGGEHHGSLSVDAQGNFSFTAADANWNGTDTFTVQITDDKGGITEVTVPVTVSATDEIITSGGIVIDGSVANTVAIKEENPLTFSVDVDSAGGTTSVAFDAPAHGSVIVNDDGSYTYQPNDDFHGTDTLTYTVTDSEGGTLVKTVTVNVENVDDAATVIVAGGTGSESITNAATVVTGTISAADVDGAITGYTVVSGGEHHGSLSVDAQGNFSFTADDANWNGTDTFTVQIADALGGVTSQQVTINVAAADDATVVTGPVDVGHVAEDSSITFTADQLLAHASDVDSNLHVANVSVPGGALATNADGSYTFTPNADFNGTLAVSYDVVTQDGVVTHTTGTIEVDAVNDAPVITVVTGGTGTESTSNAATVVTGKVSATDVEGDSLSYSVVSDGTSHNGALSVDASGNFTFTAKDSSWAGDDSFTVRVSDGQGGTVDQTVNIHVDAVADTPTLFAEAGITHEGAQLDVGVQLGAGQTVYTASNDGGTNFGNNSGTMTVHASVPNGANPHTAGTFDVYVNNVKVGSGTASATPGDVTVTFNSNFQGFNDTDSLKISGSQGTNVHIDGITINGTEIDVGSGAKWKGAQVDSNGDTADIHNGGVIYSINDGNSGGTQTPSGTSYPLSLDLTGDASQYGVTVNNLPAGSELSYVDDSGQTITLTADAQGNVNLSAAQAQDVADHGAKLTTGLNVAVSTPTAEFHLAGANGVDTFVGGAGSDTITGTSHNDVIYGDEVSSNAGHYLVDLDISGGSTDTDGSETVTFSIGGVPDGVTLAYTDAAGVDHVLTGEGGTFSLTSDQLNGLHMIVPDDGSVTDFDLSVSSIAADGSSTASTSATLHVDLPELQAGAGDILNGGAGNDTVYGSEGNDIITGGAGADVLNGGAGNDSFAMGNGDDGTWGSGWSAHNVGDTHTAGTNQYVSVTSANQLDDTIIGGEGQDTLQGSSGNDAIFLDGNDGTARLQGIEVINAGAGNDVVDLTSNNFDYGNVTIDGGSGSDVLWASSGDDTLIGGSGADNLDGGAGTDTADFSGSSSGVNVYLGAGDGHGYGGTGGYGTGGDAQGDTYTGIENVVGSSHDDYIYGSASGSTVSLGAGNDTFDNTEVSSVVVSDTVDGGAGNDLIYTGNGDDVLKGGSGNDLLYGEAGNDVLTGGTGDDNLIGGSGDDNFLFDFGAGHDTVNGGTNWTDTIDLTSFSAGATITVNVDGGTDWTVTTDNADHATQLNPDESGTITVHVDGQEDTTIAFQNIEQVKW
ncbi:MAG: tandem-95 repeat protein, partial [Rhodospirillaceae bacterium]|nr:tandem-95 repeat protein [Rhodospirillales bacterium]